MVDRIKQKYSKTNNDRLFNEFIEPPPVIIKKSCNKTCLLITGIITFINSTYFITLMYLFNQIEKYTHNDLLDDPEKFNKYINNITF